nr:hypothetical protein [Tanacetum cinerariifolium]
MKRASKGYTGVDIPLFPAIIVQGLTFQGEGSTFLVESHHTPTADEAASIGVDVRHGGVATTVTSLDVGQGSVLCTTLSQKMESLEADLKQTKQVYGAAYTKLIIKMLKAYLLKLVCKRVERRVTSKNRRVRVMCEEFSVEQ